MLIFLALFLVNEAVGTGQDTEPASSAVAAGAAASSRPASPEFNSPQPSVRASARPKTPPNEPPSPTASASPIDQPKQQPVPEIAYPQSEAPSFHQAPIASDAPLADATCPQDSGVYLTIVSTKKVDESTVFDIYKVTLELENRIEIPVEVRFDLVKFSGVRSGGLEVALGSGRLSHDGIVAPGKSTHIVPDLTVYRMPGLPVVSLSAAADLGVRNTSADQYQRHLYCEFADVAVGAPLEVNLGG